VVVHDPLDISSDASPGLSWYFRDDPKEHPDITQAELAKLPLPHKGPRPIVPWGPLIARMWPVTLTYFCYGWCLWLYLSYLPVFFKDTFHLTNSGAATFSTVIYFIGAIGNTMGGVVSDRIFQRTGNVRFSRLVVTVVGFTGALLWLVPIIYVHHVGRPGSPFAPGAPGRVIHPAIAPLAGDPIVEKAEPDAFHQSSLAEVLRVRDIGELVVCGFATQDCVDSTVRSAFARGYRVVLASGAHTTTANRVLTAAQIVAHHDAVLARFARVTPAVEITFGT